MRFLRALSLGSLGLCACAAGSVTVNGATVDRVTREWVGDPYNLRLKDGHPSPGQPTSGVEGNGGMLTGVVCGVSLDYEVEHKGQYVQLVGQLDNMPLLNSQLRIAGDEEVRIIKGSLASRVISLKVTRDAIEGYVGRRSLSYQREGDTYHYVFQVGNLRSAQIHHVMRGADELWRIPAAAQTVLLPMLIACQFARFEDADIPPGDPPPVTIGGQQGARPAGTLVFR